MNLNKFIDVVIEMLKSYEKKGYVIADVIKELNLLKTNDEERN